MKYIAVIVVLTVIAVWWALHGRPWLTTMPWAKPFFDWIEPIERHLYKKSETIFWARWWQFIGYLTTILAFIGTIDIAPFIGLVPERYQWAIPLLPVVISLAGHMAERLRSTTTLPLEVVALPPTASQEIRDKVATSDEAKKETVSAIADAKAEGTL